MSKENVLTLQINEPIKLDNTNVIFEIENLVSDIAITIDLPIETILGIFKTMTFDELK